MSIFDLDDSDHVKKRVEREALEADKRDVDAIERKLALLRRQQKALEARDKFMTFVKFTSPDPADPNDVNKSRYKNARHHDAIARVLEEVVKGNIQFLILTMPPRHGKSELVSRRLPAWYMGKFPHEHGIVATYNDDFAMDFGKEVRSIVTSPQFKQVFPSVKLQRGGSASDRLQTTAGGQWSFVGRGGSLTGRGAHCFVSGTPVISKDGIRQIQTLREGDEVLSFEHGNFCWRRVQAIAHRPGARIFRVATAAGRVVEATGDHPFYVDGRWVEAAQLTPGDRLLCAVREDDDPAVVRRGKAHQARADGFLLLKRLLGRGDECEAARSTAVLPMRRACAAPEKPRHASAGPDFLLDRVHAGRAAGGIGAARAFAHAAVRALQRHVHTVKQYGAVLLTRVRGAGAFFVHDQGRQPALEGWGVRQPSEAACGAAIQGVAAARDAARRPSLRALFGHGAAGSASHRREPVEQPGVEPCDAVPAVPREGAFFRREADVVRTVEDTGRFADVYDIQVEGSHCFFANGILVHNCLIIDDLIKDDKEAQSQAIRDQAWNWLTKVAFTRRMGKKLVIMTFTRWHADDPIGRLTDPENPHYSEAMARKIKVINFPAIAEDDDPLGRAPGEPLWPDGPDQFDLEFLREQQEIDPLGFAALYQQRPSVLDGDLFKRENIRFYKPEELPQDLRIYCASDHAVGTGQRNDPTVLLKVGVDQANNIYLLECDWRKMPSDVAVEAMLTMASGRHKPLLWWAERGHISKSIGPFLKKRMLETGVFINIREVTPASDKAQRAQSIAARVAMGKVYFPINAVWTEKAVSEMLAFPNGQHDDFVDALAYIGLGLQSQFGPGKNTAKAREDTPKFGTLAWVKLADRWKQLEDARRAAGGF